ncbi:hypothetical protein FAES_1800 [Fibrella aestuarina BUZ 2]|uniref:Helix-turn-helix domain-containing protein n=1 Tax=Fibrella aestuarina BUZ 2 TaxID=1166018 RepID=I0K6Q7_9BACT|nr:hypothetical protein [Fibrella aestuarina]CCG99810.1 hypothetical protein FAES_1800 [Fibrella aestuarina BUZ 2]
MNTQMVITVSPDELQAMLDKSVAPLKAEIATLRTQISTSKYAYTPDEVGEMIGYSADSIRQFIREGRKARGGKLVTLKATEIIPGYFRVRPADLNQFLNQF